MMEIAFIGVGSNINPQKNIKKALRKLNNYVNLIDVSTHYLTKAEKRSKQPDYINGVWKIKTKIRPVELKYNILKKIENDLGRIRKKDKFASRKIDLDLILYGKNIINNSKIKLPDKHIYKRAFICIPLYELEPELILRDTNKPVSEIIKDFKDDELIPLKKFSRELKLEIEQNEKPRSTAPRYLRSVKLRQSRTVT